MEKKEYVMICENCSAQLEEYASYCPVCFSKVASKGELNSSAQAPTTVEASPHSSETIAQFQTVAPANDIATPTEPQTKQ